MKIVYVSNSGFTEKYAKMLSDKTGIEAITLAEAQKKIPHGEDIIFMGWLMAGIIKGLKKASGIYNIKSVCAVGMCSYDEDYAKKTKTDNQITTEFFYLQGGFNINKLHGIYKLMMNVMKKTVVKKLSEKPDQTPMEKEMVEISLNGGDHVSEENLTPVLSWVKSIA